MWVLRTLKWLGVAVVAGVGWMMQTHPKDAESIAAEWLEYLGLASWGEGFTKATDHYIFVGCVVLVVVSLIAFVVLWFRHILTRHDDFDDFDVSIQLAVNHLVGTFPHSFNSSGSAERHAFQALYEAMCAGKLPVIGTEGEFNTPKRIRTRKCKRLRPIEVAVPPNPASPCGVRFHLIDESISIEPLVEHSGPFGLTGLRVRSKDLYHIWPKNQPSETRGK